MKTDANNMILRIDYRSDRRYMQSSMTEMSLKTIERKKRGEKEKENINM